MIELIEALAEAFAPLGQELWPIFAMFARLSTFFMLAPSFGERAVPARVRLGVAILVAFMLYPLMAPDLAERANDPKMVLLISEALSGFILGLSLRLAVYFLQFLGMVISQTLSISQPLGEGIATEPNPTVSTMLMLAGLTMLVTLNLHVELLGILATSYDNVPLGTFADLQISANWLTELVVGLFRLCLSLALPFVILNFAYNLILGFLNRAMPQLLVSFVGLPGITLAGLILLGVTASAIMLAWVDAFRAIMLQAG